MKKITLLFIVIAYAAPSIFRLVTFPARDSYDYSLLLSSLSTILLAIACIWTLKGSRIFKYIACGCLLLRGIFLIPFYFAPAIEELAMRLLLGSYGVFLIVSCVWILFVYRSRNKTSIV